MDSYPNTTEGLPEARQSRFTRTSFKDVFVQTHKVSHSETIKAERLPFLNGSSRRSVLHFDFHVFLSLQGGPNTHVRGFSVTRSSADYRFTTVNISFVLT